MIKLILLKNNLEVNRAELEPGHEYPIGRAKNSILVLENIKSISRSHLNLSYTEDGILKVTNMSRFGGLKYNNSPVEEMEFSQNDSFGLGPYTFKIIFESSIENNMELSQDSSEEQDLNDEVASSTNNKNQLNMGDSNEIDAFSENNENDLELDSIDAHHGKVESEEDKTHLLPMADDSKTLVEIEQAAGFLNILDQHGDVDEILKLDGNFWIAGRKHNCEIYIDNPNFSRKQFSIQLKTGIYYITDLKSSNGTYLNDKKLTAKEKTVLKSGDFIRVKDQKIKFEIKLIAFENQLQQINEEIFNLPAIAEQHNYANYPGPFNGYPQEAPGVVKLPPDPNDLSFLQKTLKRINENKARTAFVLVILFLGLVLSAPENGKNDNKNSEHLYSKLSKEELMSAKALLKQSFNYYQQQKPALCLSTLDQLHKMSPSFENSKEIEKNCKQTLEILQEEREKLEREKAAQETQEQIQKIVADCRAVVKETTTVDEAKGCLTKALELDPSSSEVQSLLSEVEINMEQQRQAKAQERRFKNRISEGKRAFRKAEKIEKNGPLKKAIKKYEQFLNAGYPSLNKEKSLAKRRLASLKSTFDKTINELSSKCEKSLEEKKYKHAYEDCSKLVKYDPSIKDAQAKKEKALGMLTKKMKIIYTDSIFDESMGQVDAAKEKWHEIMEKSVESEEYYEKSKQMLKKYGEE